MTLPAPVVLIHGFIGTFDVQARTCRTGHSRAAPASTRSNAAGT